jgi:hypothetical protein
MIKNFTKGISFVILISMLMFGCKLDPPVYPEGTVPNPNAGGENGGGGITSGTITYIIDGKTTTLTRAVFQVVSPSQLPPSGSTQIMGGTDAASAFSLSAQTAVAGIVDKDVIIVLGTSFGEGSVTFTEINTTNNGLKGTVKGTFTGKISGISGQTEKDISGSFNITM